MRGHVSAITIMFTFLFFVMNQLGGHEKEKVAEIPDEFISLSAYRDKGEHIFKDFELKVKDNVYHFKDWYNVPNKTYYPQLVLKDITGDTIPELTIILTEGTGSGLYVTKAHVLKKEDSDSYEEVPIQDPSTVLQTKLKSTLTTKKASMVIDNKEYYVDISSLEIKPPRLYDEVLFGNHIDYVVQENALYVYIGASVSPVSYIGYFVIKYEFKHDKFEVGQIKFEKSKSL